MDKIALVNSFAGVYSLGHGLKQGRAVLGTRPETWEPERALVKLFPKFGATTWILILDTALFFPFFGWECLIYPNLKLKIEN